MEYIINIDKKTKVNNDKIFINKIFNKVKNINRTLSTCKEIKVYEDRDLFQIAKEKYEYVIYEKVRSNAEYKSKIEELEYKLNE
jgi:hypothetical protein